MNHDEERSTRELQRDIEQTRSHLDSTLDAIEQRLAPRQLVDEGIDYLRHSGAREYVTNLGQTAKNDPLPLALVGVGLAWLMMSDGRHRNGAARPHPANMADDGDASTLRDGAASVRDKMSDLGDKVSAGTRGTVQRLSDTAASARERAQRVGEAARQGGERVGDAARYGRERVRGAYDYLINEQPLVLGAIGLAAGVLLAASAPRTQREDELLGSASDRIKDDAMAAGREQLNKVKSAAASARDATVDKAQSDQARQSAKQPASSYGDGEAKPAGAGSTAATGTSPASTPTSPAR
jgi:hypothetical protein